jgi:hypothetical protein
VKLRVVLAAATLLFAVSRDALAGMLPGGATPDFSIDVTSSIGGDVLHLTPVLMPTNGTYSASGSEVAPSFSILFDLTLNPDPAISGSFTLTNLSGSTQTFTVSATLGVLPIAGPTQLSGSFGDATYTDANGDASVTVSADPFYRAEIDGGGVQDLGSFGFTTSGGPGISGTLSMEAFAKSNPGGVVGTIGVAFPGFSLTPGDSLQVPFEFSVAAPEPAFASLFAIVGALILLRIARETASRRPGRSGRILPTGG